MKNNLKYYCSIDFLRGVSILLVFLHHIVNEFHIPIPLFGKLISLGFLGVDLFFVLSGFLITGILLPSLNIQTIKIKNFYLNRAFKILPQYYIMVLTGLIFNFLFNNEKIKEQGFIYVGGGGNIIFLQNYIYEIPIVAHTWSLAIEEHFYLIWPILLSSILALSNRMKNLVESRYKIFTFIIIIGIVICNLLRFLYLDITEITDNNVINFQKTHFRFDGLLYGALIKLNENFIIKKLNRRSYSRIMILVILIGLFYLYFYFNPYNFYSYTLSSIVFGLILIFCITKNNLFSKFNFLIKLGKLSYPIYLYHYPLIFISLALFKSSIVSIIFCVIMSYIIPYYSSIYIDNYFLTLRKKYLET
jgi:peptidoglycan/LPS O-acetylase OafA/YrhL